MSRKGSLRCPELPVSPLLDSSLSQKAPRTSWTTRSPRSPKATQPLFCTNVL